jgi:V8-like Glu-specific endopeptidase
MERRRLKRVLLALLAAAVWSSDAMAGERWDDRWSPIDLTSLAGATFFSRVVPVPGGLVRFAVEVGDNGAAAPSATLVFRDVDSAAILERYDIGAMPAGAVFMTAPLASRKIRVDVADAAPGKPVGRIVGALLQDAGAQPLGQPGVWRDAATFSANDKIKAASKAVVKLIMPGGTCTGFVFGAPATIITDAHCMEGSPVFMASVKKDWKPCGDISIQFAYLKLSDRHFSPRVACRVAATDEFHDLAVLKVSYPNNDPPGVVIVPSHAELQDGEQIFVVHHPAGTPQKVSDCTWNAADEQMAQNPTLYFRYRCSTLPGSSGAPVLNAAGELIGVQDRWEANDAITVATLFRKFKDEGFEALNRATWARYVSALARRPE